MLPRSLICAKRSSADSPVPISVDTSSFPSSVSAFFDSSSLFASALVFTSPLPASVSLVSADFVTVSFVSCAEVFADQPVNAADASTAAVNVHGINFLIVIIVSSSLFYEKALLIDVFLIRNAFTSKNYS